MNVHTKGGAMVGTFEIVAHVDQDCSLKQMSALITSIETETGIDCSYDGNLSYSIDGEIHMYECTLDETVQILKILFEWRKIVDLECVIDGAREWFTSEGASLSDVFDSGKDGMADRVLKAMGY